MSSLPTPAVHHVDVAILGAGTAGLNARRAAEAAGARALMIDPGPFGTTCARVGCMPSKLLIAAAEAVHHAHQGDIFGFSAPVSVDGAAVMDRVRRERDRFVGFVTEATDDHAAEGRLLVGRGRVVAPGLLSVTDAAGTETDRVHFRSLVVATGSAPIVPPPYRGLGDRLWTNEELFAQETLPEKILVVGPGVIGLELGQALDRLGATVTVLGLGGLVGPLRDPVMQAEARRIFGAALDLHPDHRLVSVERDEDGVDVVFLDGEGVRQERRVDAVLVAVGRAPQLRGLGLEQLGVALPARGPVAVDPETLQLGPGPVFLAGDATGERPLLHEAADEGRIAGANAARFPDVAPAPRRTPLAVVFTSPQIGVVGTVPADPGAGGTAVGAVDYRRQGRARVMAQNEGHVRIYGDVASRRILGAELIGPAVEHTAHLLAWAVAQGMTVDRALEMPFYHPVVEEGIRTALEDLAQALDAGAAGEAQAAR